MVGPLKLCIICQSWTHLEEELLLKRDIQEGLNKVGKVDVRGLQNITTGLLKRGHVKISPDYFTFQLHDLLDPLCAIYQ